MGSEAGKAVVKALETLGVSSHAWKLHELCGLMGAFVAT